jgi:hypothetical protein
MLDRARVLQGERDLTNVTWRLGDVLPVAILVADNPATAR